MVAPNEQALVNKHQIFVSLIAAKAEASISIKSANGKVSHPEHVSIEPFLKAGMSERDALKAVMRIASIAVGGVSS